MVVAAEHQRVVCRGEAIEGELDVRAELDAADPHDRAHAGCGVVVMSDLHVRVRHARREHAQRDPLHPKPTSASGAIAVRIGTHRG